MATTRQWTIGEVARLAHVTVRTLHHYDDVGLLTPSARTDSGYRLYERADLERLHQVLLFRELGFGLESIRRLLDDPAHDRRTALRAQRDMLKDRLDTTSALLRAVDAALAAEEEGTPMSEETLFNGFDAFDPSAHAAEAEARWGKTDAYRESVRRTRGYGKADWSKLTQESDGIVAALARLLAAGAPPTSAEAMELAEEHRRHIDRWFYPCPPAMHAALADMYEADPRFGDYFEKRAPGLTDFVCRAIRANTARSGE